jgi:hypothetical protein
MSSGLYDPCECGHLHPEHSLFGTCRGCLDCITPYDEDRDADDHHPYRQCACRKFVLDLEAVPAGAVPDGAVPDGAVLDGTEP